MMSALSLLTIALSVILSAFIRLIQTMQLKQNVTNGFTGVRELSELSGILDPRDLQDVFGPPNMNRIWNHVGLNTIEQKRRLPGYLMTHTKLHWCCIAVAILAVLFHHWTSEAFLIIAALAQLGAWTSAARLPK